MKFGLLNGCYWMLISTVEDAVKYMNPLYFDRNADYVINSINSGKLIAVNSACGFHAGNLEDYTDIIEKEGAGYPELTV